MVRVAFVTVDGTAVDEHFGRCERLDVYDLSPNAVERVEVRVPEDATGLMGQIDVRLELLRDCAIVYVASIGGAAAARVVNARIHPVKVASGTPIDELTSRLQTVLATNPPPWLRKVLRGHDPEAAPAWTPR